MSGQERFTVRPVIVYRVADECEEQQWGIYSRGRCLVFFYDEEEAQNVAAALNRAESAKVNVRPLS